jgi:hypothetical protein
MDELRGFSAEASPACERHITFTSSQSRFNGHDLFDPFDICFTLRLKTRLRNTRCFPRNDYWLVELRLTSQYLLPNPLTEPRRLSVLVFVR